MLASASHDATACLWDVADLAQLQKSKSKQSAKTEIETETDVHHANRLLHIFHDADSQTSSVYSVSFSHDGSLLAIGSNSPAIPIHSVHSKELLSTLDSLGGNRCMRFMPDGQRLVAACNTSILLWDLSSLNLPSENLSGEVAYHISQSGDGIKLRRESIEIPTQPLAILRSHSANVYSIAVHPDSNTLLSGGLDGTVQLWNISDHSHAHVIKISHGYNIPINALAFGPDGKVLAAGDEQGGLHLWDFRTSDSLRPLTSSGEPVPSVEPMRDPAPVSHHVLASNKTVINSVSFCPPGPYVVSVGKDATHWVWDTEKRQCTAQLPHANSRTWNVAFDSRRKILVTTGTGRWIEFWSLDESGGGTRFAAIELEEKRVVRGLAICERAGLLLCSVNDQTIKIWDIDTRTQI